MAENSNQGTKACPYCGEMILAVAKKCRFCGEFLEGTATSTKPNAPEMTEPETLPTSAKPEAPIHPHEDGRPHEFTTPNTVQPPVRVAGAPNIVRGSQPRSILRWGILLSITAVLILLGVVAYRQMVHGPQPRMGGMGRPF